MEERQAMISDRLQLRRVNTYKYICSINSENKILTGKSLRNIMNKFERTESVAQAGRSERPASASRPYCPSMMI